MGGINKHSDRLRELADVLDGDFDENCEAVADNLRIVATLIDPKTCPVLSGEVVAYGERDHAIGMDLVG